MGGVLAQGVFTRKSASASPDSVIGSRTGTGGVATTNASVASGTGGTVSSYAWEYVSGDTLTVATATAASTTFSATVSAAAPQKIGVYRCKVTFSDGTFIYTNNVTAQLDFIS